MALAVKYPLFVGPSNVLASRKVDAAWEVNGFIEVSRVGSEIVAAPWYLRPRLRYFASLGTGPVRALFSQDGRTFGVSGNVIYEIHQGGTVTALSGAIVYNQSPATISSSGISPTSAGHQVFFTSGGEGYLYDTAADTFSNIVSATFPDHAPMGLFFKGYFFAMNGVDGRVQWSDLYDGATWGVLNFVLVSDFSDQIIAFSRSHDNLFLYGSRNTLAYQFTGAGNALIEPIPGGLMEHGIAAPYSVVECDNAPIWLIQDEHGSGAVVRADGYIAKRISSSAVENELNSLTTYAQATAMSVTMRGHTWYLLNVPNLDLTWVYDLSNGYWYQWGHWDTLRGQWVRFMGVCHCFGFGKHLVGDRLSGAVYEMTLDETVTTDDLAVVAP